MTLCACNCGEEVRPGKKYIHNHHWRGKKRSPESRARMSLAQKNKSPEHRARISASKTGERNPIWAGDDVSVKAAHGWLNRHFGHEKTHCESCGTTKGRLDFAYLGPNGEWSRDRQAYAVLCRSCHTCFDEMKEMA